MKLGINNFIIPLLLIAMVGSSCKKKLKEYNPSGITDASLYSTPYGFESLVNAAYSYQRYWYGKEMGYALTEAGTDLWQPGTQYNIGTRAGYSSLYDYLNLNPSNTAVIAEWPKFYAALNLCNTGLERINSAGLSASLVKQRAAELKFLRAFYMWHVVETWGDSPFYTSSVKTILTTANKVSTKAIYDQLIADLESASADLAPTTSDYGRVTKYAAMAFLSRVYLTRGYGNPNITDFPEDASYFTKALNTAKEVIEKGGYSLVPNYADLWQMTKLKNSEVIYAVNYTLNSAYYDANISGVNAASNFPDADPLLNQYGGHNAHFLFVTRYEDVTPATPRSLQNGTPFERFAPNLFLLDLFDESKDSRFDGSFQTVWFATAAAPAKAPIGALKIGDTAIVVSKGLIPVKSTKYYSFDRNDMYTAAGVSNKKMLPVLKKFLDPTRTAVTLNVSARDAFVIRLAEMYLIAAEASFKLNNAADAATYINVVRDRAGKAGKKADMVISAGDVTLDFILDERAREFAGEQMRWFDLKRTNKTEERIKAHNPVSSKLFESPKHLLRPIPQDQMDAVTNKDEFKQNQGY